jgi:glycosyltransferase involved in cell wall biosynthesis
MLPPVRRPARVLFLSSCVRGGGAGYSLYYLLKYLDRTRIEPLVVVPDEGIFKERFAALGVRVVVPRHFPERTAQQRFARHNRGTIALSYAWNLADSAWLVPALRKLIKDERIDLVYCNNMMVKPIGAPAAQLADVPCVLHVRNLHEKRVPVTLYCDTVARLPAVKLVIANSEASAVPYRRSVPEKVVVVHNGVDLSEYNPLSAGGERLRREMGFSRNDVVVVFTGNLIPRKGVDVLIRAFARCAARNERMHLLIAGRVPVGSPTDYKARYEALAHELGVSPQVRFLGFLSDVRALVAAGDVLVLPSLQEPFGRSIIEAMALGTSVIASRVGGIPEVLDDGREGLLVPPSDDAALERALAQLAESPELRRKLAIAAERKVSERFDIVDRTREMQDLLLSVAERRASRPPTPTPTPTPTPSAAH